MWRQKRENPDDNSVLKLEGCSILYTLPHIIKDSIKQCSPERNVKSRQVKTLLNRTQKKKKKEQPFLHWTIPATKNREEKKEWKITDGYANGDHWCDSERLITHHVNIILIFDCYNWDFYMVMWVRCRPHWPMHILHMAPYRPYMPFEVNGANERTNEQCCNKVV